MSFRRRPLPTNLSPPPVVDPVRYAQLARHARGRRQRHALQQERRELLEEMSFGDSISTLDPPLHTPLRSAVSGLFKPGAATALEEASPRGYYIGKAMVTSGSQAETNDIDPSAMSQTKETCLQKERAAEVITCRRGLDRRPHCGAKSSQAHRREL